MVDYGEIITENRAVSVTFKQSNVGDNFLEVSADNSTWRTIVTTTTGSGQKQTVQAVDSNFRYVRLRVSGSDSSGTDIEIYEIVIGDPTSLPVYTNGIDAPNLAANGITEIPGTFVRLPNARVRVTGHVPPGGDAYGVEGNALWVVVEPGQGTLLLFANEGPIQASGKVLIRAAVWTNSEFVQVFVGIMDTDEVGDIAAGGGSLGLEQLLITPKLENNWACVSALHDSQSGFVRPVVQVVGTTTGSEVYVDNVEVYAIPQGADIPADLIW